MFNIGWSEMLVIVTVLVLVVGPKEMPRVLFSLTRYMRQARTMANEFRRSVEAAVYDAEVQEVQKELGERYTELNREFNEQNPGAEERGEARARELTASEKSEGAPKGEALASDNSATKGEPAKGEPTKEETAKGEPTKEETAKGEPPKREAESAERESVS